MSEHRFKIEHGTIHDLTTGRHVRTEPDFGPGRKFEEDGIEQCCDLLNALEDALTRGRETLERAIGERADMQAKLGRSIDLAHAYLRQASPEYRERIARSIVALVLDDPSLSAPGLGDLVVTHESSMGEPT